VCVCVCVCVYMYCRQICSSVGLIRTQIALCTVYVSSILEISQFIFCHNEAFPVFSEFRLLSLDVFPALLTHPLQLPVTCASLLPSALNSLQPAFSRRMNEHVGENFRFIEKKIPPTSL
jgi:hypothetical protein